MKKILIYLTILCCGLIQLSAQEGYVYIGDPNSATFGSQNILQNMINGNTLTQIIYLNSEISQTGLITHLNFRYNSINGTIRGPRRFQFYMSSQPASLTQFTGNNAWISAEQFTLVYDGLLPVNVQGEHDFLIPLDTPFVYKTGSLVIGSTRTWFDNTQQSNDTWLYTARTTYRVLTRHSNTEQLTLNSFGNGTRYMNVANMTLIFDTNAKAHITGTIMGGTPSIPLSGAKLTLNGTNRSVYTNSQGVYLLEYVPGGNIGITVSALGYEDLMINDLSTQNNQITTYNLTLDPLPRVSISGRVLASDTSQPLAWATVYVEGYYLSPVAFSDAQGNFTITNVFGNRDYILVPYYHPYLSPAIPISLGSSNINMGDIFVNEATSPPRNLEAIDYGNATFLEWKPPYFPEPGWISHIASDPFSTHIGFNIPATMIIAHRFSQNQLASMGVSGANLTTVEFVPRFINYIASTQIRIYTGGSSSPLNPGTLVYTQDVTVPLGPEPSWTSVLLNTPIPIPTIGEMWIAVQYVVTGAVPLGADDGPHVQEYGNIFWHSETGWTTIYDLGETITSNWSIRAKADNDHRMYITNSFHSDPLHNYAPQLVNQSQRNEETQLTNSTHINISHLIATNSFLINNETSTAKTVESTFPLFSRTEYPVLENLSSRTFEGSYNIYRTPFDEPNWLTNKSKWIVIAANYTPDDPLSPTYLDQTWANIDIGHYRYIIESVYTNNNHSSAIASNFLTKLPELINNIGDPYTNFSYNSTPISVIYESAVSQTIYYEDEINMSGNITGLILPYTGYGLTDPESKYHFWIAHTIKEEFDNLTDWVPFHEFTHVFSGYLQPFTVEGVYNVVVNFSTNFNYLGGNIVLLGYKSYSPSPDIGAMPTHAFICTQTPGIRRSLVHLSLREDLVPPFDNYPEGRWRHEGYGNVGLIFDLSNRGHLVGTIKAGDPLLPVPDAEVKIPGTNYQTLTDAQGYYSLDWIPVGGITLLASKHGYQTVEITDLNIIDQQTVTKDIVLSLLPTIIVSGKVIASDTNDGLAEAIVKLTGYENYESITNLNGDFSFSWVYANYPYHLSIAKLRYYTHVEDILAVGNSDLFLGNIILYERINPVNLVVASNEGMQAKITWDTPNIGDSVWLSQMQNETYVDALGVQNGGAFQAIPVHRFTQNQLEQIGVCGGKITKMYFRIENTNANVFLVIYTGGTENPLNPGTRVYTQQVLGLVAGSYNEITLTTPFIIPSVGELWIGYEINFSGGGFPLSLCAGEQQTLYGDLFYWEPQNIWTNLGNDYPYSFMIKALVEDAIGPLYGVDNSNDDNLSKTIIDSLPLTNSTWLTGKISRGLDSYNIYRFEIAEQNNENTWDLIGTNVIQNEFIDLSWIAVPVGQYKYAVKAVYTGGFSENTFSNVIIRDDIEIPSPTNLTHQIYDNNILLNWEEPEHETSLNILEKRILQSEETLSLPNTLITPGLNWEFSQSVKNRQYTPPLGYIVSRNQLPITDVLSETSYTDQNVLPGTYTYSVVAVYTGINSAPISIEVFMPVSDSDIIVIPLETVLKGNYPNPFNPSTVVSFDLATSSRVKVEIYNIRGQKVCNLVDANYSPGRHNKVWNGMDDFGKKVSSGIYFYQMSTDNYVSVKRMLLLK